MSDACIATVPCAAAMDGGACLGGGAPKCAVAAAVTGTALVSGCVAVVAMERGNVAVDDTKSTVVVGSCVGSAASAASGPLLVLAASVPSVLPPAPAKLAGPVCWLLHGS